MSTPVTPARPSALTVFEQVVLGVIAAAPAVLPIFVHSNQGILLVNAGETLLASILQSLGKTPNLPGA